MTTRTAEFLYKLASERPEEINNFTEEEILIFTKELQKKNKKVGLPSTEQYSAVSVFNWSNEYMKRIHTSAIALFMPRVVNEYFEHNYLSPKGIDRESEDKFKKLVKYYFDDFVKKNFTYQNTDTKELSRGDDATDTSTDVAKDVSVTTALSYAKQVKEISRKIEEKGLRGESVADLIVELGRLNKTYDIHLREWIPQIPDRSYEQLNNYDRFFDNNFADIESAAIKKYYIVKDAEISIIIHKSFADKTKTQQYIDQYKDDYPHGIYNITNGQLVTFAPHPDNVKQLVMSNKNTEMMDLMMAQHANGNKLANDMLKKKVKVNKEKNIKEAGPVSPAIDKYISYNNLPAAMGSKQVLSKEEVKLMEETKVEGEGIEVPVWINKDGKMHVTSFHTQEEIPLHTISGEYKEEYQPVADENNEL